MKKATNNNNTLIALMLSEKVGREQSLSWFRWILLEVKAGRKTLDELLRDCEPLGSEADEPTAKLDCEGKNKRRRKPAKRRVW